MKNVINLILCAIPFAIAIYFYPQFPHTIPTHYNLYGEADGFGSKNMIFLEAALPLIFWVLYVLIPKIDPKSKLVLMGGKYQYFSTGTIAIITALSTFMILSALNQKFTINILAFNLILAVFFLLMGNYMSALKPNYFIGIRTPWTLESEYVWKKTHVLGGKLFFIMGILLVLFAVIKSLNPYLIHILVSSAIGITIITGIYSYWLFKKEKKEMLN